VDGLSELLATNQRQALEFFLVGLKDVSGGDIDRRELLYTASVLAHYAQVSTHAQGDMPAPPTLAAVFDRFVADGAMHGDSGMLETAAAQCLLLSGFFERQMQRRHSIRWYADLGAGFFRRAARLAREQRRAELLELMGRHFEPWRGRFARLSRELGTQRYVIAVPPPRAGG
jgi:hypothetical protein